MRSFLRRPFLHRPFLWRSFLLTPFHFPCSFSGVAALLLRGETLVRLFSREFAGARQCARKLASTTVSIELYTVIAD